MVDERYTVPDQISDFMITLDRIDAIGTRMDERLKGIESQLESIASNPLLEDTVSMQVRIDEQVRNMSHQKRRVIPTYTNSGRTTVTTPQEPSVLGVEEIITKYLSYQDADLSNEDKKSSLKASLALPSAQKYAKVLQRLDDSSMRQVIELAVSLEKECSKYLAILGVTPSPYAQSRTWAIWDIAKQMYMMDHPEQTDVTRYNIGNPLQDGTIRFDILDRHLGWELENSFWEPNDSGLEGDDFQKEIDLIYLRNPHEDGTLPSSDYTALGKAVRQRYRIVERMRRSKEKK